LTVIRVVFVSGVLVLSGGCFLQKKPAVQIPVAVPPAPVASTPSAPAPEEPATVQNPPAATVQTPTATPTPAPSAPATDNAKPSPFPPVARPNPPRQAPASVTTPPGAAPAPGSGTPGSGTPGSGITTKPSLGAIMTSDERRQLDAAYLTDLSQANVLLGRLNGKNLTAEQLDSVNRAKAWIRQAGQYHSRDLATAAELARRARVLTQDLTNALK
jgi:translation initiation factor IF-2